MLTRFIFPVSLLYRTQQKLNDLLPPFLLMHTKQLFVFQYRTVYQKVIICYYCSTTLKQQFSNGLC